MYCVFSCTAVKWIFCSFYHLLTVTFLVTNENETKFQEDIILLQALRPHDLQNSLGAWLECSIRDKHFVFITLQMCVLVPDPKTALILTVPPSCHKGMESKEKGGTRLTKMCCVTFYRQRARRGTILTLLDPSPLLIHQSPSHPPRDLITGAKQSQADCV